MWEGLPAKQKQSIYRNPVTVGMPTLSNKPAGNLVFKWSIQARPCGRKAQLWSESVLLWGVNSPMQCSVYDFDNFDQSCQCVDLEHLLLWEGLGEFGTKSSFDVFGAKFGHREI